jgi:hypothetical protein
VIVDIMLSECTAADFVQPLNDSEGRRFGPVVRYLYGVAHGC